MDKARIPISDANILYFTVCALVVFIGIPTSILLNISYGHEAYTERVFILISQVMFVLFPILVYLAYKAEKINIKSVLRLNPISTFTLLIVILISICSHYVLSSLNMIIAYFFEIFTEIQSMGITPASNILELIISIFVFALIPSICEELLHRGIMLNAYERRGTIKAIIISAILFGVFHYDVRSFLSPIIFGIILGYIVVKTDSIFAAIAAHFVNNIFTEIAQFIENTYSLNSVSITMEQIFINIPSVIVSLVILLAALKLLSNTSKTKNIAAISGIGSDIVSVVTHWPIVLSFVIYISISVMFVLTQVK